MIRVPKYREPTPPGEMLSEEFLNCVLVGTLGMQRHSG
jgi:plasmid maintenance system antidote protein VapI